MTALNITRMYKESVKNNATVLKGKLYEQAMTICSRLRGENLRKVGNSYVFRFEEAGAYYLYYITSTKELVIDYEAITPYFC